MKKYYFLLVIVFILISAGCGIPKIEPITTVQEESMPAQKPTTTIQEPKEKVINWCDKSNMEDQKEGFYEGKLWISSEYFNGMNHGPTIRHFCHENKEIFTLEMVVWEGDAITHHGKLISKKSKNAFSISSTNTDPEVKLLEEQNKNNANQVWFTLDDKIFMYDENTDKFSQNPKI